MSNEHNIDTLLKESFDNFSPEAPDVWQAVQQGVQAAQASGAAASGTTAAVQGVSLTVKIIAGITIAAASITAYVLYNAQVNNDTVKVTDPVVKEQTINQPELLPENDQTIKEDFTSSELPKGSTKITKQPGSVSHSAKQTMETEEKNGGSSASASVAESESIVLGTKHNEQNMTPDSKEAAITEAPKTETKIYTNNTGDISKPVDKAAKTAEVKPYNPYAEEGEVYEKPTVPNVFTPNDDGSNDKFKIIIENETYYSLKIINEKGEMVFESKNKEQLWDGKHYKTGHPCSAGNYIYILNYQYKGSEKPHETSGLVKLIF